MRMSAAWCWGIAIGPSDMTAAGRPFVLLTPRLTQTMRSSSSIAWILTAFPDSGSS